MANRYFTHIRKPVLSKAIREQIREIQERRAAQERARRTELTSDLFAERHDYAFVKMTIAERVHNQYERRALQIASRERGLNGFQLLHYYNRILRRALYDRKLLMPSRTPEQLFSRVEVQPDGTKYTLDFGEAKYNYRINLFYDAVNYLKTKGPIGYAYLQGLAVDDSKGERQYRAISMNDQMCRSFDELVDVVVGDDYDIYEGDGTMLMTAPAVNIVVVPVRAVSADDDGLCVPRAICRAVFKGEVPIVRWDTKKYFMTKPDFAVEDFKEQGFRYKLIVKEDAWKKINACDKRKIKSVPTSADIVKHFLFSELEIKQYRPEDYMQLIVKAEERFDLDIVTYTDEAEIADHVFTHRDAIFICIKEGHRTRATAGTLTDSSTTGPWHATLSTSKVPRIHCYDCKGYHYDGVTYKQYIACQEVCEKCGCKRACRLHNCSNVFCEACNDYVAPNHKCDVRYCEYCRHKRKVGHTCYMSTETKKIAKVDALIVDSLPENPEAMPATQTSASLTVGSQPNRIYYSKDFKRDVLRHLGDPGVQILRRANEFYQLSIPGGFTLRDYRKLFGDADADKIEIDKAELFNYTTIGSYCYDQLLKSLEEKIERYDGTDAMFKGGRLEVFSRQADGRVEVWDYASMYPGVMYHYPMFTAGYKIGVDEKWINSGKPYFIKCTVLPPRDLLYPVLPTTIHMTAPVPPPGDSSASKVPTRHKQLYTLCRKCAELECSECSHTDEEREITDWFSSIEFELALRKGYTYRDVTEIIVCTKPSSSIFRKYIGEVYRAKEAATGETRKFHKMRLNSCFGKFAQSNNRTESVVVRDRFEGERYLGRKPRMTEVKDAFMISYTGEPLMNNRSNVLIAAWITAVGRFKLYSLIEQALEQGCTPLYCNTDSLFVEGRFAPKDELSFGIKCEGVYSHFRCLAPNYYSLDDEVSPKNLRELKEVYEVVINRPNYTALELEQVRVFRRLAMRHPKRLEGRPYGYAVEAAD